MDRDLPFTYRKKAIRWLDYARRSWKRLGHLKVICSISSPSYGMNLEGITARFQSAITSSKVIPEGITKEHRQRILEYINTSRSNQYKTKSRDLDTCEQQQYYLADPRLPSHSGVLTGKSRAVSYLKKEYVEIPTWAVRLGLLRKANYTLTERGKVLLALQTNSSNLFSSEKPDENPYLLTPSDKYFFLFCLLDVDGDIIKRLYRRLVLHSGPFSKNETSDYMIESLAELKDEIKKRRSYIAYSTLSNKINSTIEVIKNTDQVIVPRLEPFVDCGLLRRSSQQNIEYEATSNANLFIENLNLSGSIDEFINENLAVNTVDLLGLQFKKNLELLPRYIARSYTRLRSGIGYCSIKDLAILAVAYSIGDGFGIFEIGDVERAIIDFYRRRGTNVRFTKNRQGNVAFVKFDNNFIREISGAG
jgi:hypothetical protein